MATSNYILLSEILSSGDSLCESMHMDTALADKLKEIYTSIRDFDEFPLIRVALHGYDRLVWGFITCAIRTNIDLHTGQALDLQKFLGYSHSTTGQTALHKAAKWGHFEVINILLQYVSKEHLTSYRDVDGRTPLSFLREDPRYDSLIFANLKAATHGRKVDQFVSKHQAGLMASESKEINGELSKTPRLKAIKDYKEVDMAGTSYPTSHKNKTHFALDNLNSGICELTPNRNTILHLVSKFGDVGYTKSILEKHPSLIERWNSEGENPLYVAAAYGNADVLEILINHVKDNDKLKFELTTRSNDKLTALHIAIEKHYVGVVFLLVKEIPKLAKCINCFNESPLYLAVERRYYHIFRLLLDECKEIAFEGKNGATALHAAVAEAPECVQDLLRQKKNLLRIHNNDGWTPLHYAVFYNKLDATNELLKADPNAGYQMTKIDGKNRSAIHIAVSEGHHDQIRTLYSYCPGCFEMTDTSERNILHVAIEEKRIETFYFILNEYEFATTHLINQRDRNGNTPFNLLAASDYEEDFTNVDKYNTSPSKDNFLTPVMKAKEEATRQEKTRRRQREEEEKKKKEEEKRKQKVSKMGDNVILVITLIATATFAAAFSVPGGYDSNEGSSKQGMPILLRKTLYKAFVVSNALAFSCSCCVLFAYVRLQLYNLTYDELGKKEKEGYINIINLQYLLTGVAMIAIAVAFVTGTYLILAPSHAFAISL